jgi:hypothetical protein
MNQARQKRVRKRSASPSHPPPLRRSKPRSRSAQQPTSRRGLHRAAISSGSSARLDQQAGSAATARRAPERDDHPLGCDGGGRPGRRGAELFGAKTPPSGALSGQAARPALLAGRSFTSSATPSNGARRPGGAIPIPIDAKPRVGANPRVDASPSPNDTSPSPSGANRRPQCRRLGPAVRARARKA